MAKKKINKEKIRVIIGALMELSNLLSSGENVYRICSCPFAN